MSDDLRAAGFSALPSVLRELTASAGVDELLARAAGLARTHCGFRRALVLTTEGEWLVATTTAPLEDMASDVLRRRALRGPQLWLHKGTEEARLVAGQGHDPGGGSELARALELDEHAFGLIAYDGTPLGLLVVDRPGPPIDALERSLVSAFAGVIAVALRAVVLQARVHELSSELRFLTSSIEGFMHDVLDSALPTRGRHGPTFSRPDLLEPAPGGAPRIDSVLTPRERDVAEALAAGRSNREIAAELHLAPDTVKGYVAQVLRKLDASNRAEAVAQFMRLTR